MVIRSLLSDSQLLASPKLCSDPESDSAKTLKGLGSRLWHNHAPVDSYGEQSDCFSFSTL